MSAFARTLTSALIAGGVTRLARVALAEAAPGPVGLWDRTNHRGETISLLEGPAVAAGLAAGALFAGSPRPSHRLAQSLAVLGAGGFGLYDDLAEDTSVRSKGLKGHLRALSQGTLTTGGLKILGIGATAAIAAGLSATGRKKSNVGDFVLDSVIIAGSANLINLLDLRPGRAFKALALPSAVLALAGNGAGGAIAGSAVSALPRDLNEQDMLGDCGANALGALAGTAFVQSAPRSLRCLGAVGIVGLTLLSEKVSFSKVIANNPTLNAIDMLGRRAPEQSIPTMPSNTTDTNVTAPTPDTDVSSETGTDQ